jgi:mannan endo-1,4-beta-mannosidase
MSDDAPVPSGFPSHFSRRRLLAAAGMSSLGFFSATTLGRSFAATKLLQTVDIPSDSETSTFSVQGRHLVDPCGERVILRGVNKMAVWDDDPTCADIFPQIRMTHANVVRIVWLTDGSGEVGATVSNMNAVIRNCRANHMIPLIELHDATGDWSKLGLLVQFWTRPDVLAVIKTHEKYVLLNIGNEVGGGEEDRDAERISDATYREGYAEAIKRIRAVDISIPLVIDAAGWGHDFSYIANNAQHLLDADPLRRLLFSLHVWWGYHGADAASDFKRAVDEVVAKNIPFIVGEFSGVGGPCDVPSPYAEILDTCHQNEIGWLAWEWGPGNEFGTPPCLAMNMTGEKDQDPNKNGRFANLKPGWARQVAIEHPHSIRNTAVTPRSLLVGL